MKHILHYVRKDLTHHWLLAALTIGAIALDALDTRYGLFASNVRNFPDGLLTALLKWPLCFLFVAAVVQEDKVVAVASHWLTRPVHPLALLVAKLLTIVGVVVVPQAFMHAWTAHYLAVDTAGIAFVAAETFCITLSLTLIAVLLCANTRSVLESCVWIVVGFLGFYLVVLGYESLPRALKNKIPNASNISGATRLIIAFACGLPAALGVLCLHYTRRSRALTVAIAVAAALVIDTIALQFPRNLVLSTQSNLVTAKALEKNFTPTPVKIQADSLGIISPSNYVYDPVKRTSRRGRTVMVRARMELEYPDRLFRNGRAATTLTFADGSTRTFSPVQVFDNNLSNRALRAALGLPPAKETQRWPLPLFGLQLAEALPTDPEIAQVELQFEEHILARVAQFSPDQRIHLRLGSTIYAPRPEFRERDGAAVLALRFLRQTSLIKPNGYFSAEDEKPNQIAIALHHPRLDEYSLSTTQNWSSSRGIGLVQASEADYNFRTRVDRTGKFAGEITPEWLAETEVFIFRTKRIGLNQQTLTIPKLVIPREDSLSDFSVW